MKVFTPDQMRAFDREAVEKYHIPSIVLMENAALRVVEFCEAKFAPIAGKRVLVACGKGNNGGDGFAIARHLSASGCLVTLVLACKKGELSGDALVSFQAMSRFVDVISAASTWPEVDIVIDALLGTGFKGDVRRGPVKTALEKMDDLYRGLHKVVSVDVPSGLNAETGEASEDGVHASYTVTFVGPKCGFFVRDGLTRRGETWVGRIGTDTMQMFAAEAKCETVSLARDRVPNFLPGLPTHLLQREPDAHKGTAGRVLIIGGCRGMSGAVALSSRAALATGAGLCLAMVPDAILDTVAASVLEATTTPLPCDADGALVEAAFDDIATKWGNVQCVAVGPGVGRSVETLNLVRRIVRECPAPLVVDADALYALPMIAKDVKARKAPTILTPHPGEMAQLLGTDTKSVQNDRYGAVQTSAKKYGATVVLKGAYSLICDGGRILINTSGNPGMATGGSGDVLTGIIAAMCAGIRSYLADPGRSQSVNQAMDESVMPAAQLGVYVHGLAGDIAFKTKGNGLTAGDIVSRLGDAVKQLDDYVQPDEINPRLRRLH